MPEGGSRILWVIHVDPAGMHDPAKRCRHVNYVSNTHCDGEAENLFTAYSVFTVRTVEWGADAATPHCLVLDAALDNKQERKDLPLTPWY